MNRRAHRPKNGERIAKFEKQNLASKHVQFTSLHSRQFFEGEPAIGKNGANIWKFRENLLLIGAVL